MNAIFYSSVNNEKTGYRFIEHIRTFFILGTRFSAIFFKFSFLPMLFHCFWKNSLHLDMSIMTFICNEPKTDISELRVYSFSLRLYSSNIFRPLREVDFAGYFYKQSNPHKHTQTKIFFITMDCHRRE